MSAADGILSNRAGSLTSAAPWSAIVTVIVAKRNTLMPPLYGHLAMIAAILYQSLLKMTPVGFPRRWEFDSMC